MPFGVEADIISVNDDFEDYKLIIAPMLFLIRPETIEKMTRESANNVLTKNLTLANSTAEERNRAMRYIHDRIC